MNTFIYSTGNPAKIAHMGNMLALVDVIIIGLKDMGIALPDVYENGNTPLENARIKALTYFTTLRCPLFACDSGLYIDGLLEFAVIFTARKG